MWCYTTCRQKAPRLLSMFFASYAQTDVKIENNVQKPWSCQFLFVNLQTENITSNN